MSQSKVTPSRQQYLDIKAQHPDAIVFFRLGDFYETFDDDAHTAAQELDLVLTSRPQGKNIRVPMAGVPHHAVEGYIAKLIAKGYKVALAEQMGDDTVKGLMPREVIRVFTAGTVIEPGMLDAARNNYLAAVISEGERAGLAYVDITTGEFATTQVMDRRILIEELARLSPSELLIPDSEHSLSHHAKTITRLPNWRFEEGSARQTLLRHFAVNTLAGFGCEGKPLAVRAAGVILYYLQETQKGAVGQIQRLATYSTEGYMALDMNTRRNLELIESISGERLNSLFGVLNKTVTAMGARLLRQRVTRPLLNLDRLNQRLDRVEAFYHDGLFRADIRAALKNIPDLERLTNRVLSGKATPRDLEHIGLALTAVPALQQLLNSKQLSAKEPDTPIASLHTLSQKLDAIPEVAELVERAIVEDAPTNLNKPGVIKPGFSAELDGVMNSSAHARDWVAELEPRERERTGISSLKVGFNKVFGYYIEVTKANAKLVPDDYIRKQTLTNAERYITPDLKEYETLILNAEDRILQIEKRVFTEVCQYVAQYAPRLLETAVALAQLDVSAALAEVAATHNYIRPVLNNDNTLWIENGRHPVVEQSLERNPGLGERFVPNNVVFRDDERIQIITGPNMSGKSTYLRQVALIVLMAQMGSFVPAGSATIGLADRIFTRIGAHDELHVGRSTFMVEMVETAEILHHASHRSLLILDEIGRGTSTYDGLAIAWAIVEFLHNHPRLKPRTLFATHYHELVGLADMLPLVSNYNV
ncbi:MAG: DNA mismatch repair protein MutS, partial [Ardenticatenaceae bacterium]|nr:DNA mismatch repair protein MutS [Ardenticatenaceae bacterium]